MLVDQKKNRLIRPPRIGQVKIGEKTDAGNPKSLDYFVIDSEYADKVKEVYGEKPKMLRIFFPFEDIEDNLDEMYRFYGSSGLKCIGDGATHTQHSDKIKIKECGKNCNFLNPPENQKQQCFPSMIMGFVIKGVGVTGVWHFSSKAVYSRNNVRASMAMVKAVSGKLAGMPFIMRVEMRSNASADSPNVFPVVTVDCEMDIEKLAERNIRSLEDVATKQIEAPKKDKEIKPEPEPNVSKKKFKSELVQKEWDNFNDYLEENKSKVDDDTYVVTRHWLDTRTDNVTNLKINTNYNKFKEKIENPEDGYETYHEELIKACMKLVKSDREGIIALLDQIVFRWHIPETSKLIQATENECLNLLEEFENIHKNVEIPAQEEDDDLPF